MYKFIQDQVLKTDTVGLFGNLLSYSYQEVRDNDIINMAQLSADL